jgi:hypothetical protein
MNTARGETAQVPGQRSKTIGDHIKTALPWIGGALALGAAGYGAYQGNLSYQNSRTDNIGRPARIPSSRYRDPFDD